LFDFLRPVGAQDQVEKGRLSFFQLSAPRCLPQVGIDADEVLAFVLAQVEDLEGAVVLALRLELPLYADQALVGGVNGELAEVRGNSLAAQLFGHGGGGAGAHRRNRQSGHLRWRKLE